MRIFEELKRRNVFKVGFAYAVACWLMLQIVDLVLDNINAPEWVMQVFMLAMAVGFPIAIIIAWAFEVTPDGVKLEKNVERNKSIAGSTGRQLNRGIIMILSVAVVFLLTERFRDETSLGFTPNGANSTELSQAAETTDSEVSKPTPVEPDKSIAVLPFINMSDDEENEYFSDGISEELLNVLIKVDGLRVPSRTSSFTFKGSDKKITEIGRELQVDNVLEGSVRKSGDRIRVTAQLIDVDTDTHLWSETYTRKLDDIFAVQDEIAQAIVNALKVTLTGAEEESLSTRPTYSTEAYNKFLLGRHLWNQRTPESLLAAVEPLVEAVEMDPAFERAWGALADAYVLIPEYGAGSIKQYIPLGREAIEKVLAINPGSAHALTTSAYIKYMFDYDFTGARTDFLKAIDIDPAYATAHQWYGELLAVERNIEAAITELKLARQLDPLSPVIPHVMGWVLQQSDRKEEAYQYYQEALDIDPYFQPTIGNLIDLDIKAGRFEQARERCLEFSKVGKFDPSTMMAVINAVEKPELAEAAIKAVMQDSTVPGGTTGKAFQLMYLNEHELALDELERSFAEGDAYAVHMNRLSAYDPLRSKPRFQALLAKMNLWP